MLSAQEAARQTKLRAETPYGARPLVKVLTELEKQIKEAIADRQSKAVCFIPYFTDELCRLTVTKLRDLGYTVTWSIDTKTTCIVDWSKLM